MGIQLKEGISFNPPISTSYGIDMTSSDYYGVIDNVEYNKKDKNCHFSVEIFCNCDARANNSTIVDRENFSFNGDTFDSEIGKDGLSIPQAYAKALERLTDWQSDE